MWQKILDAFLHRKKFRTELAILVATGVVLFWRGMWGLLDLYLFPHNVTISYLVSLILGLIILKVTHKLLDELL